MKTTNSKRIDVLIAFIHDHLITSHAYTMHNNDDPYSRHLANEFFWVISEGWRANGN